ncbi:MAG: hypothetical protein ACO1OG_00275 [Devosia sp.]
MKLAIALGAAALTLITSAAFAEDYAGGAIKTSMVDGKEILTDANGMTLYIFDKDTAGVSNCNGDCAVKWPPLMAADGATDDGEFTIVTRADGTKMWAHEGMPLYLWIEDTAAGMTTGDGVGGVWHTAMD